ncbi:thioredoxin family protein [uncultured Lutibacter sp.]|uniref:thioredoxin family protein n=1 Tax=uncultured Lutibacter sp. TaxID=437739 RepID=UPI0026264B38|nr:thioredoxin family protein [uncultured Lutibacter sp.]
MKTFKTLFILTIFTIVSAFTLKTSSEGYKIGDTATDFKLKNIDGKMVSMADYKHAKGFIVIFTCNHCPYSIAYEDRIIELDKNYKEKGYSVIAINPNNPEISKGDDFISMQKRAKEKGFTFPYLFDDGQNIYPQYGASRTPHVFLLNKEGKDLKVAYIGAIDNNYSDAEAVTEKYVEDAINALIDGEKPNPNFTKAIGCSIKK